MPRTADTSGAQARRLVWFVSALMTLEILPAYVVTPLVPGYIGHLRLSDAQVGVVVSAYAVGSVVASIPTALLARRIGVRLGVVIGLGAFAASTVLFGLAESFVALVGARLVQGAAGALYWTSGNAWVLGVSRPERRGEMLGTLAGATAFGAIAGPPLGGLAVKFGTGLVFGLIAAVAVAVAVVGSALPDPGKTERVSGRGPARWYRTPSVLFTQWLVAMPGMLIGVATVVGPLVLSRLGWGATAIVLPYLAASAGGVALRRRIGRTSDRRGRIKVIRPLLVGSAAASLALYGVHAATPFAVILTCGIVTFGLLWGPALALTTDVYEQHGVTETLTFGLTNASAGVGIALGSAGAGAIAQLWSDSGAFAVAAVLTALTVIVASWLDLGPSGGTSVRASPSAPPAEAGGGRGNGSLAALRSA